MKIVHIIPGLETGGAEIALYRTLAAMRHKHECEAAVVSLTSPGDLGPEIEALGVPVIALGMRPGFPSPAGLWRLHRYLTQLRPDLLQGWMYHGNMAAHVARWLGRSRIPVFWNVRHSLDDLPGEKPALKVTIAMCRRFSGSASCIIYNSRRSALQHEEYGFSAEQTAIISNGFDTELFRPNHEAGRMMRQAFGLDIDAFVVGLIARFHPIKGHALFLRAAAIFSQRHPQARFVLAGKGLSAGNATVVKLVRDAGIADRVILAGVRNDLPEFLNGIDLVTLTSQSEAFPNVLGEAMACGIPCVTTDVGDAAWLIGKTGFVVPCGDANALCQAWEEILALDSDRRQQLGAASRKRIEENFSQEVVVEQYLQLYRNSVIPRQ